MATFVAVIAMIAFVVLWCPLAAGVRTFEVGGPMKVAAARVSHRVPGGGRSLSVASRSTSRSECQLTAPRQPGRRCRVGATAAVSSSTDNSTTGSLRMQRPIISPPSWEATSPGRRLASVSAYGSVYLMVGACRVPDSGEPLSEGIGDMAPTSGLTRSAAR
jgi:hypothetical protein